MLIAYRQSWSLCSGAAHFWDDISCKICHRYSSAMNGTCYCLSPICEPMLWRGHQDLASMTREKEDGCKIDWLSEDTGIGKLGQVMQARRLV